MKFGYIYVIKNTANSKLYIGKTEKTINKRWNEHLRNAEPGKREQVIYHAMRKYGKDKFYIEFVEKSEVNKLNVREKHWIKKLKTLCPNGYNMTEGGDFNDSNPMHFPEIAKKVSLHFIGDKNPAKRPEVREKIRQKALGRTLSLETRKKMSENQNRKYWLGKKLSQETRDKISENHGTRGKFGSLNPNSKKVARIDKKTDEILEVYGSFKEAESWVRTHIKKSACYTSISKCCNGKQKTSFGFKWSYVEKV